MLDPKIVIVIPSLNRERWLGEVFIENINLMLLKPVNSHYGKDILKVVIYVQNAQTSLVPSIEGRGRDTQGLVEIVLWDTPQHTPMSRLRMDSALLEVSKDNSITHIIMMDDDLHIFENNRLVDHFIKFIDCIDTSNTVYVVTPSTTYSQKEYITTDEYNPSRSKAYLSYIRFQCYPVKGLIRVSEAEWAKPCFTINDGEDTIIPAMIYCALKEINSNNARLVMVHGFDEIIHLSTGALYTCDIFRKGFRESNPEISLEYQKELEKKSLKMIEDYHLGPSGFNRKVEILNGGLIFHKLYPWVFDRRGNINTSDDRIRNMLNNVPYDYGEMVAAKSMKSYLDSLKRM